MHSKYLEGKSNRMPRVGVSYQATRFPVFKRVLPWGFSFGEAEKEKLKAKLKWRPTNQRDVEAFLEEHPEKEEMVLEALLRNNYDVKK